MKRPLRRAGVFAIAAMAAACSDFPPTQTANPENIPPRSGDIVSVCYSAGDHSRAEIAAVARQICPYPDSAVTPWHVDTVFNDCPLLKKSRISFRCTAPAGATLPPRKQRGNVGTSKYLNSPSGSRDRRY